MKQRIVLLAALALATVASAAGYYLPGTYPQEFFIGQQLQGKHEHDLLITCTHWTSCLAVVFQVTTQHMGLSCMSSSD